MISTQMKLLMSAFIVIILGVVLIQSIGDDVELVKVGSRTTTNESVAISSGAGTLANDELHSFDACRNSTMITIISGVECNVTLATGTVVVNPINFTDNLAYIDYKYEPDTYVHSSAARTILTLVILFFVIGILTVGIGFAWKALKDSGVL